MSEKVEHIHLAEIIEDEMKARGWTLDDLIMNMGPHFSEKDWAVCHLSWEMFLYVREPNIVLGESMAQQLADAFNVDPRLFMNLHESWRKSVTEAEERLREELRGEG